MLLAEVLKTFDTHTHTVQHIVCVLSRVELHRNSVKERSKFVGYTTQPKRGFVNPDDPLACIYAHLEVLETHKTRVHPISFLFVEHMEKAFTIS